MSAGEKYQIDDRQDQHGDKTYNRPHDIQRRSIVFGKGPKSPKPRELETGQLHEADGVFGDVFYRGVALVAIALDQVGYLIELRKVLFNVAHAATLIVWIVAAVQRQVCSEMEAHECAVGVIV